MRNVPHTTVVGNKPCSNDQLPGKVVHNAEENSQVPATKLLEQQCLTTGLDSTVSCGFERHIMCGSSKIAPIE